MEIMKALHELKQFEIKAQELYGHYQGLFQEDKEAAGFFLAISDEEKSHADIIEFQIKLARKNKKLFGDVEFDIKPVSVLVDKMDSQIRSAQPVSLESAIQFSISLEMDSIEHFYRTLMAKSNPEVVEFICKLGADEKEHVDKLNSFAASRGYKVSPQ
jgi:rubrerythrin